MPLKLIRGNNPAEIRARLTAFLPLYEEDLIALADRISIKGKSAGTALKEQTQWPSYYSERKAELNTVVKYIDSQTEACRGRLFQQYTEKYSRELADRVKDKYIDKEVEYLEYHELMLEAKEMYDKFSAIVDAFSLRGFALRDWVQLSIHDMQDTTI